MDADVTKFQVWANRCSDRTAAIAAQTKAWKRERFVKANEYARAWASKHMKFAVLNDLNPDQCLLELTTHEEAIKKSNGEGHIVNMGFLNWAAPSTIVASSQQKQASLIGGLMAMAGTQENSYDPVCLAVMPQFAHRRATLWVNETNALKLLSGNKINTDRGCCILFEKKADERDERPLMYSARLLTGTDIKLESG
eukprot:6307317-Alexandrium_andersonii.AAC.1